MTKALVLFSGGLDSRLAVKLLQEQNIKIEAIFFLLPFGGGCCNDVLCSFRFAQMQGIRLHIIDCTKGLLLREYLSIVKKPKYGYGRGINPCIDCRIFMLKKAKKLAKKIKADFIATGEVLGERPMSQHRQSLMLIEKESGLIGKILRPLSAKLLPETDPEKKGLIDREKLLDIHGRNRKKQIALAKKFRISYPPPAGGCLLCEDTYSRKLKDLFKHKNKISIEDIKVLNIGRHFRKNGKIILGRNKEENEKLQLLNKKLNYNIIIPEIPGPTVLFENKKDKKTALDLQKAYSSKNLELREKFEKYRL